MDSVASDLRMRRLLLLRRRERLCTREDGLDWSDLLIARRAAGFASGQLRIRVKKEVMTHCDYERTASSQAQERKKGRRGKGVSVRDRTRCVCVVFYMFCFVMTDVQANSEMNFF